ncbi:MAG TPA: hypothetical protein VHR72_06330, partial [Gemmataceae bacterium]|nr:hypothetical protein [Gemmataceae bacterium]
NSTDAALTTNHALSLGNVTVGVGNLTVVAAGNITQVANASVNVVGGDASFNATNGAITLGNAGNAFNGTVSLANTGANNVTVRNNLPLTLGNVTIPAGKLSAISAGNVSQASGTTISMSGNATTASFNAVNGSIDLSNANAFGGVVSLTNNGAFDVDLTNNVALKLGNVSVGSGNLSVTANNGNITRAANVTLTVNGAVSAQATNGTVNL